MNKLQDNKEIASVLEDFENEFVKKEKVFKNNRFAYIPKGILNKDLFDFAEPRFFSILPILFLYSRNGVVDTLSIEKISSLTGIDKRVVSKTLANFFEGPRAELFEKEKLTKKERRLIETNEIRKRYLNEFGFRREFSRIATNKTVYGYMLPAFKTDNKYDQAIFRESILSEFWNDMNQTAHMIFLLYLSRSKIDNTCPFGKLNNKSFKDSMRTYETACDVKPHAFLKRCGISKTTISDALRIINNLGVIKDHPSSLLTDEQMKILKDKIYEENYGLDIDELRSSKIIYLGKY